MLFNLADQVGPMRDSSQTLTTTLRLIASDFGRYRYLGKKEGSGSAIGTILFTQGLWASIAYRLAHWAYHFPVPVLGVVLRALMLIVQKIVETLTLIRLPAECEIGAGLYIGHFGPIIVNPKARIGCFCNLSPGITIGKAHRGSRAGVPRIGDRVYIGPNAIVIGDIIIGDDVAIGAGAVVTKSVPERAVVAGNPARVFSYLGSFEMVHYEGMGQDIGRKEALSCRSPSVESK